MLYILGLGDPIVRAFEFKPSEFPAADGSLPALIEYDSINLETVTNQHGGATERNMNLNLEISRGREEQTLMILFLHNRHNVIA